MECVTEPASRALTPTKICSQAQRDQESERDDEAEADALKRRIPFGLGSDSSEAKQYPSQRAGYADERGEPSGRAPVLYCTHSTFQIHNSKLLPSADWHEPLELRVHCERGMVRVVECGQDIPAIVAA